MELTLVSGIKASFTQITSTGLDIKALLTQVRQEL